MLLQTNLETCLLEFRLINQITKQRYSKWSHIGNHLPSLTENTKSRRQVPLARAKGTCRLLKIERNLSERCINAYSEKILALWEANMD